MTFHRRFSEKAETGTMDETEDSVKLDSLDDAGEEDMDYESEEETELEKQDDDCETEDEIVEDESESYDTDEEDVERECTQDGIHFQISDMKEDYQKIFDRNGRNGLGEKKLQSLMEMYEKDTPGEFGTSIQELERTWSEEELQDIYDNDPGYIDELVYKDYPKKFEEETEDESKENFQDIGDKRGVLEEDGSYMETGFHDDLVDWDEAAVEGTEMEKLLPEGNFLVRYGSEKGRFLTEPGTEFKNLHLNVSEDKLEKNQYEVLKPLPTTESIIRKQRFDEPAGDENNVKEAKQFYMEKAVEDLVKEGFLRKCEKE